MSIKNWMNGKSIIFAILLALLMSFTLYSLIDQELTLSGLDLFFAAAAVISLGFNLWQLFRDHYKYAPLKNSLIGLFNDLKARQLRVYSRQNLITSQEGMKQDLEAVRLQFFDFVFETSQNFEQLREHVVAAIHSLDPEISTQHVFRAAEFGLTEQERRFREEGMEKFIQQTQEVCHSTTQGTGDGRKTEPERD